MKKFLLLATYIVTFFVLNGVAAATNEYYGYFVDIDSNHDEYITWEEFYRYFPFATRLVFDKIDSDHNALVSYDEWRYFKERYGYGNRRRYGQQYVDTQGYRYIFIDGFWYKVGHRRRHLVKHGYYYYDPTGLRFEFLFGYWYKSGHGFLIHRTGHRRHPVIQKFIPPPHNRGVIIVKPQRRIIINPRGNIFGRHQINRHRNDHAFRDKRKHVLRKRGRRSGHRFEWSSIPSRKGLRHGRHGRSGLGNSDGKRGHTSARDSNRQCFRC